MNSSYKNNTFKILFLTCNGRFDLPDESDSVSDIQDYFEYIIKKPETVTENPPIRIYLNRTEKMITFKIKAGYHLQLLVPKTMKLLEST